MCILDSLAAVVDGKGTGSIRKQATGGQINFGLEIAARKSKAPQDRSIGFLAEGNDRLGMDDFDLPTKQRRA